VAGSFGVVFLGCWPFLEVTVVYWRCPCAGRHLLSLLAAKKVGKESGFTPPTIKWVPRPGRGSGPINERSLAHQPAVTRQSSAPTPHYVRRGWVRKGNRGCRSRTCSRGETRCARRRHDWGDGETADTELASGLMNYRDGARSAAGRMTALSRARNVRGHRFQMFHCPLEAKGPAYGLAG
jgi:hypothetical protein